MYVGSSMQQWCTVRLFLFVTFHDDITQEVVEVFIFWKKIWKDIGITFNDVKLLRLFNKNLIHLSYYLLEDKFGQKYYIFFFWDELSFFRLLSFQNGLSHRYQIGLKWKLIWSCFRIQSVKRIKFFLRKSYDFHIKKCIFSSFLELFSEYDYHYYFLNYVVLKCYKRKLPYMES